MITYILLFIFYILSITFVIKFKHLFKFYDYKTIQKTHFGYVPRLGGILISIYFLLICYLFIYKESYEVLNTNILISGFFISLFTIKEDLYGNTKPLLRLLIIFIFSLFAIYNFSSLPKFDNQIISYALNNNIIEIIFYSICLTILSNGNNMIDGMNGLASFAVLSILCSLIILSAHYKVNILNI